MLSWSIQDNSFRDSGSDVGKASMDCRGRGNHWFTIAYTAAHSEPEEDDDV